MIGIYKITSPSGSIYIGQSINIQKRFWTYRSNSCKYQTRLKRSFEKYGVDAHLFEIIEECKKEQLDEREKYYINYFKSYDTKKGLNLSSGGTGKNRTVSKETKAKMSISRKGKKVGKDNGRAVSVCQYTLDGKFVKKFDTIRDANKELGKKLDSTSIIKAAKNKGRNCKTAYNYQWKLIYQGEEIPKVDKGSFISKERAKKGINLKKIAKLSKSNDSVIKIYNSIKEASEDCNLSREVITRSAKDLTQKRCRNYYWRYLKDISLSDGKI